MVISLFALSVPAEPGFNPPEIAAAVDKLIQMHQRPTISDIKNAFPHWPSHNPFQGQPNKVTKKFEPDLIAAILSFEQMYPGWIYVGLGRDMAGLVDMMDAYYQSKGQFGRSIRLDGSGDTIRRSPLENLAALMKAQGIDLDHQRNQKYVLYDYSSYESNSQLTRLIVAAYSHAQEKGSSEADYLKSFSALNMNPTVGAHSFPPEVTHAQVLAGLKSGLAESFVPNLLYPSDIPLLPEPLLVGITIYNEEWHDAFGPLIEENGRMTTKPGEPASPSVRHQILYELYEVINRVNSPGFSEALNRFAETHHYSYRAPTHLNLCRAVYR
jgi:hypothetical protein